MDKIIKQMMNRYSWEYPYALQVSIEYKRFLVIRSDDPDTSPSDAIDMFWHQHILNTKAYKDFCYKNFEKFIDHDPEDAYDKKHRLCRLQKSVNLYRERWIRFTEMGKMIQK